MTKIEIDQVVVTDTTPKEPDICHTVCDFLHQRDIAICGAIVTDTEQVEECRAEDECVVCLEMDHLHDEYCNEYYCHVRAMQKVSS